MTTPKTKQTPGQQSQQGVLFEMMRRPGDLWRALDYVFDCASGAGVVYVMSGWYDPYGGRGCASGTVSGEPSELPNGRWQVGEAVLRRAEGWNGPPDLDRIRAARYAYADSRSEPGP